MALNISTSIVSKEPCLGKCDYNFNYPTTTFLQITNNGDSISFKADQDISTNPTPVTYGGNKYTLTKAVIYSPSLHSYENQKVDGELMIEHIPISGVNRLCVFIPLSKSVVSSKASSILSGIIDGTSRKANKKNDITTLTVNEFTFGVFIPKGPFFNYTGLYGTTTTDFIVYGKESAIAITQAVLDTLQGITDPSLVTVSIQAGTRLYLNAKGSNLTFSEGDGIYIRCKPTGKSEETTEIEVSKTTWGNAWTPNTFQIQLIAITLSIAAIVVGLLYGIYKLFDMISPTNPKTSSPPVAPEAGGLFTNMMSMFSFS